MEYSSMRSRAHRLPPIVRNHTDDENHSVFDYPFDNPSDDEGDNKPYGKKKKKKKNASSAPPPSNPSPSSNNHPYPSSISIQMGNNNKDGSSPPATKSSKRSEFRSPSGSPSNSRQNGREARQPNSPKDPAGALSPSSMRRPSSSPGRRPSSSPSKRSSRNNDSNNIANNSELAKHHRTGLHHFHCNRLSEAVDSYSLAIRFGLEELMHRKEMVSRMMGGKTNGLAQDDLTLQLGHALANVHFDMAKTLEVAQKYTESKVELENGLGLLEHTCLVSKSDKLWKNATRDVERMDRATSAEEERKRGAAGLESGLGRLQRASDPVERDDARRSVMGCLKKLLRIERDSLGEHSYAYAKLKLKLAKFKCEGGDIDGGLRDANSAVGTIKSELGRRHTLVGASCLFVATVYEKRASMMYDNKSTLQDGGEIAVSSECKSLMNKALELYADALEPLQFKYDHLEHDDVGSGGKAKSKGKKTAVRPDVGETFHKIAKLYARKGSNASAVDAYHRSLEAYGATNIDRSDVTKRTSSSFRDVHPDTALVWHDLAALHLSNEDYSGAVHASEKAAEVAHQVLKECSYDDKLNERMESIPILAYQIAGDAYAGMGRHEDAARSFREAYSELKKAARESSTKGSQSLGPVSEAKILRKLSVSLFNLNRVDDAKAHLTDALRALRSSPNGQVEHSTELPALLCDFGMVHNKCGEYADAMKALRSSLKLYADKGMSDRSFPEVEKARRLFVEAQRRQTVVGGPGSSDGGAISPPSKQLQFEPHAIAKTNSPSKNVAGTPATTSTGMLSSSPSSGIMSAMMSTPRSAGTSLTVPSTGYSRASSGTGATSRSGHGQLQTLLEELTDEVDHDAKTLSPKYNHSMLKSALTSEHSHVDGQSMFKSSFASDMDSPDKFIVKPRIEDSEQAMNSTYEVQRLKMQLEDAERMAQQYQLRVKEVEAERDQERKERIFATAAHRKEMEALAQSNTEQADMKAELESLRKEVNISEMSYQELVRAIDEEKEKINSAHETKVRELQNEIRQLNDQLKYAGAVENNRLSEELAAKKREITNLTDQNQRSSEEVASLQSKVRTLQSEKQAASIELSGFKSKNDQLQNDSQRLSSELAMVTAKVQSLNSMPKTDTLELKKLEFELQQERSRRMILESSLQKEYDRGSCGSGGMGGFAYPMPFGYPPMQVGGGSQENNNAKLKTLEIDLATERASKEMLENVVNELRTTHEQEKEAMQSQYSSCIALHEHETSELVAQVGEKRAEVDLMNQELINVKSAKEAVSRQLHDTMGELADVKQQLVETQHELSSSEEEKRILSDKLVHLKQTKDDLLATKEDLHKIKAELKIEKDSLLREKNDCDCLREENRRLKKEYLESIAIFEAEVERAKDQKEEVRSSLSQEADQLQNEINRLQGEISRLHNEDIHGLQSELGTAKLHLQNMLTELEAGRTDAKHLKMAVDASQKDVHVKEEQLHQAHLEINELTRNYEELEANLSELEDMVASEKEARNERDITLYEQKGKLDAAEKTIEELNKTVSNLGVEKKDLEVQLNKMRGLKEKSDEALKSVPEKLSHVLPDLGLIDSSSSTNDSPDDEGSHPNLESLGSRVSSLLSQITAHVNEQKELVKLRSSALEKAQWNLTKAADDLDTLECKHKTLQEELSEMAALQKDYDELLEQYELVVESKKKQDERHKTNMAKKEAKMNKSLLKAQEECELFETRLKEAVDDLEELECERDTLQVELDRVQAESVKKEGLLNDKIHALETDVKLIETLKTALSEKDDELKLARSDVEEKEEKLRELEKELESVLSKKDNKVKALEGELQMTQSRLDSALENETALLERDEKLKALEEKLELARSELDKALAQKGQSDDVDKLASIEGEVKAAISERDDKLEDLERELESARSELKEVRNSLAEMEQNATTTMQSFEQSDNEFYPDILPLSPEDGIYTDRLYADDDSFFGRFSEGDSPNDIYPDIPLVQSNNTDELTSWRSNDGMVEQQRDQLCLTELATNPFADDDSSEEETDANPPTNPFSDNSSEEEGCAIENTPSKYLKEAAVLKERVNQLEIKNKELSDQVNQMKLEKESRGWGVRDEIEIEQERQVTTDEIAALKAQVHALNTQLKESREEVAVASTIHDNDTEVISCLQKALDEKNESHTQELNDWKNQVDDLHKQILQLANEEPSRMDADELAALEDQVRILEEQNVALTSQLTEAANEHDALSEEITSLRSELQVLQDRVQQFSAQLDQSKLDRKEAASNYKTELETWRSRAEEAEQAHITDQETIASLHCSLDENDISLQAKVQQALSDQEKLHREDLDTWRSRMNEAEQVHERDQTEIMSLQQALDNLESGQEDIESLQRDKLQQALSDQDECHQRELDTWKSKVEELEKMNQDMHDKLRHALDDQDKFCKSDLDAWKSRATEAERAHERDLETISSLQNDLNVMDNLLQDKLQQALSDRDEAHKKNLDTMQSQVVKLEQLNRELSELSEQTSIPEDHAECTKQISSLKMDLQNSLNDHEEAKIKLNLELASVNAEFHNVCCSLDELQKENQKLIVEIDTLQNAAESVKSRNFEKEMNSAHTRFESMEKALQDRISRLEREKDKLVADFTEEMINKEEEHTQTKIELSAWKLEMQNALNDIESLKKERDELKTRVESYVTSLEAVCMGKAKA